MLIVFTYNNSNIAPETALNYLILISLLELLRKTYQNNLYYMRYNMTTQTT